MIKTNEQLNLTQKRTNKLHRKRIQDSLFDKNENEFFGNIFEKHVDRTKVESST